MKLTRCFCWLNAQTEYILYANSGVLLHFAMSGLFSGFGWLASGRIFGLGARFGVYEILTAFCKGNYYVLLIRPCDQFSFLFQFFYFILNEHDMLFFSFKIEVVVLCLYTM